MELFIPRQVNKDEEILSKLHTLEKYESNDTSMLDIVNNLDKRCKKINNQNNYQFINTNNEFDNFIKIVNKCEYLFIYALTIDNTIYLYIKANNMIIYLSNKFHIQFFNYIKNTIPVISYDIKDLLHIIYNKYHIKFKICWDCSIAAHLLNENLTSYTLETLYSYDAIDISNLNLNYLTNDIFIAFGCVKVDALSKLFKYQYVEIKKVEQIQEVFKTIEMPLIFKLFDIENQGFSFDYDLANKELEKITSQLNTLQKSILDNILLIDSSLINFNLNSYNDLMYLFNDILKLNIKNTNSLTLKNIDNKLVKEINDYKQLYNKKTLYEKILKYVNNNKIKCMINQYGAKTGRLTTYSPNLQGVSNDNTSVKKYFHARKHHILLSSDFEQQEIRLLAYLSNDEYLRKIIISSKDIYSIIASKVFNLSYEECIKNKKENKYRNHIKLILLGLIYGRGIKSIAKQLNISYTDAKNIQDTIFDKFKGIKNFQTNTIDFAKKNNYVFTIWGRQRHFEETDNLNTQAVNAVIQGSGADLIKKVIINLSTNNELTKLGYKILLSVHDEIIGECPIENADKCKQLVKQIMETSGNDKINIPMTCEIKSAYSWV